MNVNKRSLPLKYSFWQRVVLITLFVNYSISLYSQIPSNDTTAYYSALNDAWAMINENTLLPLQDLDKLRPVFISQGLEDDQVLWATLNTYLPVGRLDWDGENLNCHWPGYPQRKSDFNMVILAIHKGKSDTRPLRNALAKLDIPIVSIFFGKPYQNRKDRHHSANTVIVNKEDTPWAQSLSAQMIFGAVNCEDTYDRVIEKDPAYNTSPDCQRLAFAPPATVGMNASVLEDSIAHIINEGLQYNAFPGAQVLVAKDGVVVYHKAFGFHTSEQEKSVKLTDIYDLASITKISAGLPALMQWYGEGEFDLDAPLKQYFPAAKGNKKHLTYRSILAHNAQLLPWIPFWQNTLRGNGNYPWSKKRDPERINDYDFRKNTFARDSSEKFSVYVADDLWLHQGYQRKMMKAIMRSPLNEKSGYQYSGLFFYLLPQLVAQKSGMDFETYLQKTFYEPLGAHTLGYRPKQRFSLDRIIPTEQDTFFRMAQIHGDVHDEGTAMMGGISCNAGLFASAYDLAKLQQMYLNFGNYGGKQYISPEAIKEFTSYQYSEEGNRRGLGFDKPLIEYDAQSSSVAKEVSAASFGHSGYTGTFTWADPDNGLLFIFLSNRVYPKRTNRAIYTKNIRPRIHTVLYQAIND